MDIVGYSLYVSLPMMALAAGCSAFAGLALRASLNVPNLFVLTAQFIVLALWILALVLVPTVAFGDWDHIYWSVQFPLLALLVTSGLWGGTGVQLRFRGEDSSRELSPFNLSGWYGSSALWFFVMTGLLAIYPLVLHTFFDSGIENPRGVTSLATEVWELARWGLGGELPAILETSEEYNARRGMGYLPRVVTVTFGPLLIAAWYWIAYSVLWIGRRLIPVPRARAVFCFLGPFLATVVLHFTTGLSILDHDDVVWKADPATMRSFGPVVVIAMLASVVITCLDMRDSRTEPGSLSCTRGSDTEPGSLSCTRGSA